MILILAALLMFSFQHEAYCAPSVSAYGKSPAPADNSEKGFVATTLAIYSKFKSIVKWTNRCYLTYKSINYTYEEIEYWLRHFNDYWANVYSKFESASKYLKNGDIANAVFGLEDMFLSVDHFFIVEVRYLDYLLNRDLSRGLDINEPWATDDAYENALHIIETIYDNTQNIRSVTGLGDKDRRRPSFEWYMFASSQAMQKIGKSTEQLADIKLKIDEFKDLNSSLQTLGENLAQQKLILMSLYELEIMEYQLASSDLEINRNALAEQNSDLYKDVHSTGADVLSCQNILDFTKRINPYEKAVFMDNQAVSKITQDVESDIQ